MARAYQRYGKRRRHSPLALLKFPLFVLGLIGLCSVFYVLIANPPERQRVAQPTPTAVTLSETEPVLGQPDAPVRFFLYCDLAGPECARFHQDIEPKLREEYIDTGKVAIVFRNTPQNRLPAARPAANAAMCAHGQGKFWEMYAQLLESQNEWRSLGRQAAEGELSALDQQFVAYAEQLGLDAEAYQTCLAEKQFDEDITADIDAAKQANANSIYAFRINQNPVFVGSRDYSFIQRIIEAELP